MMGLYRALKRVFGSIGLYVDTATSTAWTYLYPPKTDLQMEFCFADVVGKLRADICGMVPQ
jgi:hypothetical protein